MDCNCVFVCYHMEQIKWLENLSDRYQVTFESHKCPKATSLCFSRPPINTKKRSIVCTRNLLSTNLKPVYLPYSSNSPRPNGCLFHQKQVHTLFHLGTAMMKLIYGQDQTVNNPWL